MVRLPSTRTRKIEYLVDRRFHAARMLRLPTNLSLSSMSTRPEIPRERREQILANAQSYSDELARQSDAELDNLYEAEKNIELTAKKLVAENEEKKRFFNQPQANADYAYWAKVPYWTLDEALALSFGRDPLIVNLRTLQPYAMMSNFATEYYTRDFIFQRAKNVSQLGATNFPGNFLAWAKRNSISFPEELEKAVLAHGVTIADWQALYEELRKRFDNQSLQLQEADREKEQFRQKIQSLADESAQSSARSNTNKNSYELRTREKETLLKLIIGMAAAIYGYEPGKRFSKAGELKNDLEAKGIFLDSDTIRKWLEKASEFLPGPDLS